MGQRPKIGLVISSGSTRGLAAIGLYRVLEARKVPIEVVVGASVGAIVASGIAAGISAKDMHDIATSIRVRDILAFEWRDDTGILSLGKILNRAEQLLGDKTFEELPIRLGLVANDMETSEVVAFSSGKVIDALRSVFGVSGLYPVARRDGRYLVDGGFINPLPVDVARQLGAEFVIALDVGSNRKDEIHVQEQLLSPFARGLSYVVPPQLLSSITTLSLLRRIAGLGHTMSMQVCIERFQPDILLRLEPKLDARGIDRITHTDIRYRELLIDVGEELGNEAIHQLEQELGGFLQ